MRALRAGAVVLAIVAGGWATRVAALSSYYTSECQTCHGAPPAGVNTCAGCHSHGTHSTSSKTDINVSAALNKSTFTPGETMTITVTGGYRDGWARVVLLDDGMHEVARSSCGTPGSGPPTPCATSSFVNHTLTMSQAAPTAAGAHNWAVAW